MQFQLFLDYRKIVNSCSFIQKYDAIFRAFDKVYTGPDHPPFGRKGYRKSAYLKALIYKQCEKLKYTADLIRDLENRPAICMLIGFEPGRIPDASRFSRFLSLMNNSELEELTHSAARLLIEVGHVSTDVLIGDSKPIKANTVENNPENPNRCLNKTAPSGATRQPHSAIIRTSSSLRTAKNGSSPTSGASAPMFWSAAKGASWSR